MNAIERFLRNAATRARRVLGVPAPAKLPPRDPDCEGCRLKVSDGTAHRKDCTWLRATDTW